MGWSYDEERKRRFVRQLITALADQLGSMSELARRIGVNTSTITRWARNDISPTIDHLAQISQVSGQSLGDILMAVYGVPEEEFLPTGVASSPGIEVEKVIGEDGRVLRGPGRYRLLALLPCEEP